MKKKDINQVFAENLAAAMRRKYGEYDKKQSELSRDTGGRISQKTISNLLSVLKPDAPNMSSPTLSTIEPLAKALNIQLWELLHPNSGVIASDPELDEVVTTFKNSDPSGRAFILRVMRSESLLSTPSTKRTDDINK